MWTKAEIVDRRADDAKPDAATATGKQRRVIESNPGGQPDHEPWAYRPLRRRGSRLVPLEYTLLGLVAVGIAITAAMAIFNPSG